MTIVDIKVPQMGEGLTEVRLLEFMKSPGDPIARDEVIYTMETDKATLEVESPEAGILQEWLAAEGDVMPIGATIARISQGSDKEAAIPAARAGADESPAIRTPAVERVVPPRTRAYARELGITDAALARIPSATGKLMPSDLDAFQAGKQTQDTSDTEEVLAAADAFTDRPLPDRQRKLNFHLKRSAQIVVPGTIGRPQTWSKVREFVSHRRQLPNSGRPTEFQTFAYCTVQATTVCPKFRCALIRDDTIRQFDRLNLGIAVALPDGELTTAVVTEADLMPYAEFIGTVQKNIRAAREGDDQADASVQLLLTYMGSHGVRDAIPVLVAPAAAVIFLGESYESDGQLYSNVALTFDHRLMNGVEAAEMLAAIADQIDRLNVSD